MTRHTATLSSYIQQGIAAHDLMQRVLARLDEEGIRPDGDGVLCDSYSVTSEQFDRVKAIWEEETAR